MQLVRIDYIITICGGGSELIMGSSPQGFEPYFLMTHDGFPHALKKDLTFIGESV